MNNLRMLNDWKDTGDYIPKRSAQIYFQHNQMVLAADKSRGSACGTGDDPGKSKPKPSACGSACGTGDDPGKSKPKPSACGSACGAGDEPGKSKPKPSA